jgi:Icc-related predicted phosphoesterase
MRLLFVTDLHGSTQVLEKAVEAANEFDADVLLIGGDLSGKRLLPVISQKNGTYVILEPFAQPGEAGVTEVWNARPPIAAADLPHELARQEARGFYWHETDEAGRRALNAAPDDELRGLFEGKIYDRIRHWAEFVNQNLNPDIRCVWIGGNDDDQPLLDRLLKSELGRFEYVEDKVVELDGFELLSYGHSNRTGFYTAREVDDDGTIFSQLQQIGAKIRNKNRCIFNIHVPPFTCGNLDSVLKGNGGQLVHVGSEDVLRFIMQYEPIADFAGHIHEGRGVAEIGRTMVFNPGSEFQIGKMSACVVEVKGAAVKDYIFIDR